MWPRLFSDCLAGHIRVLSPSAIPCWGHILGASLYTEQFWIDSLLLAITDDKESPDRQPPPLGHFPRADLLLQAEFSKEPVSPFIALTVSPGVAWCLAHSVLAPGWPALALALSFSAVAPPRYRPSAGQGGETGARQSWAWQLASVPRAHASLLPPINAQAPHSPGSLEPPWAVDRSCALLPGSLPLSWSAAETYKTCPLPGCPEPCGCVSG